MLKGQISYANQYDQASGPQQMGIDAIVRTAGEAPNFPLGQAWVTSWGSQFVNFNSGLDGNYRVATGSPWKNAASDGKDIGADVDGVLGATAHTPTGNWSSP